VVQHRTSSRVGPGGCALAATLAAVAGLGSSFAGATSPAERLPTVGERVRGLERRSGLLELYVDRERGSIWLSLPAPTSPRGEVGRHLYVDGLETGLGSNPVGLDRGELGPARIVIVRRVGGRVLFEQVNPAFRAITDSADERRSVEESFATSVIWGGAVAAMDPDGRTLVDWTSFAVRDAHGVAARLAAAEQGDFRFDPDRSAPDLEGCLVFPDNVELSAVLTWSTAEPGPLVRGVAPAPEAVTLVQHHSLLRLPAEGYRPRRFDPRAGSFAVRFSDYAAALDAPVERAWIVRHRLVKLDPGAARSRVERPIVYYVDRGVPEPVRGAVIEGAGFWARAFEAAGFVDAFRVELLPEGVHPLDARYNVIEWVHRATRGWSYGGGIIDPRSGEMVKGHVRLGSLRVRHDRLLFEGLLGTERSGSGSDDDPVELALDRIRQLAAHEVGHALGLEHNFAASTYGGRASVMDYPAPLVRLAQGGGLDTSEAYTSSVGVWDEHAIRYAYAEFPRGADEDAELERIVADGLERGLLFLTDADARPAGAAHPLANLWDNGADPAVELGRVLAVRRAALDRFGERNIAPGRPLALLDEVLATVYFHHRYQLEAATRVVGGLDYRYALRGDGQPPARPVDGERQRRALAAILAVLDPAELALDERLLGLLLPRPAGYESNPEQFGGRARPSFDALAAAATAADMVLSGLLEPERCTRIVEFHSRDASLPSLEHVLSTITARGFESAPAGEPATRSELRREIQRVMVGRLIDLASSPHAPGAVRARVDAELDSLLRALDEGRPAGSHERYLSGQIRRYLERPAREAGTEPAPPPAPPGSPIGAAERSGCSLDPG